MGTLPQLEGHGANFSACVQLHQNTAMGFSPYYFMYGKIPGFLLICTFEPKKVDMNATTSTKFAQQLHERLKLAYKTTQHVIEKNKRHMQNYHHMV